MGCQRVPGAGGCGGLVKDGGLHRSGFDDNHDRRTSTAPPVSRCCSSTRSESCRRWRSIRRPAHGRMHRCVERGARRRRLVGQDLSTAQLTIVEVVVADRPDWRRINMNGDRSGLMIHPVDAVAGEPERVTRAVLTRRRRCAEGERLVPGTAERVEGSPGANRSSTTAAEPASRLGLWHEDESPGGGRWRFVYHTSRVS